ncbi:hypothetical protein GCM10020000_03160 [Streptomyces olivoverticillatus]
MRIDIDKTTIGMTTISLPGAVGQGTAWGQMPPGIAGRKAAEAVAR